jgi:hypothetical protein
MNNLVFIKHMGGKKHYLFEVPMAIKLKKGDKVFCDTMYARQFGECVTDSFYVDDTSRECIVIGCGAYEPLKSVVGYAVEKKVYDQQLFDNLRCYYGESLPF